MSLPVLQPSRTTVMIKPVGALCNMDCTYCYYLPTKTIYDGHEKRMSLTTLENIFASVLPTFGDEVTIAWQGGEPTLAGLDFFRKAMEYQAKYTRPNQRIHHALQTNGTLLDDDWCLFLRKHQFLVGISVDGPPHFHDHYRISNRGKGSHDQVLRGMRLLQKHAVEYNILCVLNDFNVNHPDEVLHYLLNLGSRWLQFIPAIEWVPDPEHPGKNRLAPYSPSTEGYGKFLCRVFDLWFERYRKRVSIRIIDAVLNKLVLGVMPFCILDGSCHNQLTIEHDGAVFGCDHFIERRWQLAQIGQSDWHNELNLDGSQSVGLRIHGGDYVKAASHGGREIDLPTDVPAAESDTAVAVAQSVDSDWYKRVDESRLGVFAARKQHLPPGCVKCEYKPFCHGGCPKHRSQGGEIPEPTILCEAYKAFYSHALVKLEWLAGYLRQNRQPPDPQPVVPPVAPGTQAGHSKPALTSTAIRAGRPAVRRNDVCPCGSGLKFKHCHGKNS